MAEQPAAEIVQPTQQLAPIQSPAQPVALVRRDNSTLTPYALEPQSQKGLIQLALDLHESQLWQHKFKNAQQVGAVVMAGRSRGIPAVQSLEGAYVVHGVVSWAARTLHALCLTSPDCEYMDLTEYSMTAATVVWKRRGRPERTLRVTLEEAKLRGFVTPKSKWATDPKSMLIAMAEREGARIGFPECVAGMRCKEEMEDTGIIDGEVM